MIYTGESKENNDIILAIMCNGFENENEKFNLIVEHFNPEIESYIEDYNFTFTPQNNLVLLHKSTDDIVIDLCERLSVCHLRITHPQNTSVIHIHGNHVPC